MRINFIKVCDKTGSQTHDHICNLLKSEWFATDMPNSQALDPKSDLHSEVCNPTRPDISLDDDHEIIQISNY